MIKITPIADPMNIGLSVRKVPSEAGTTPLAASDPPKARARDHDAEPSDQHVDGADDVVEVVLPVRPAKADPLLLPCEVKAYRISVNPCGPAFSGPALPRMEGNGDARHYEHGQGHDE